jgi:signal transduction histidine kinase
VSIHNAGPPIAPDALATLFEPFARPGDGRHGWGLGLTLVRGSAEAHGGRAWVESTPENGTTFTMELPLRQA